MKKLVLCSIMLCTMLYPEDFLDISKYGYEQYQDIIINNVVVKPATGPSKGKDCVTRYSIIQKVLDQYQRPFTMIDLGASQGYYSFRAAHDYDCVCVMVEGNNPAYPMIGDQILDLCKKNSELNNIILLNKMIVPEDLHRLSECEHFDVIVAFNIIHRFFHNWKEVADIILNMGDNIIVETPPQETVVDKEHNKVRKEIENYLMAQGATKIGKVKRHTSNTFSTIYLVQRKKEYLQRKLWCSAQDTKNMYKIVSNFTEKKLIKKKRRGDGFIESAWQPGVNLLTHKMYSGTFPTKDMLKQAMREAAAQPSSDFMPNNMIVQGKKIALIDYDEPRQGEQVIIPEERLKRLLHFIDVSPKNMWKIYAMQKRSAMLAHIN